MIAQNGLGDRVFLKGTTRNMADVLVNGALFVFPSEYEGFGLTLAEAMSMGLYAIGYKNCAAVNELILDGENGLLSNDGALSLAEKMRLLTVNKELRCRMGQAAKNSMNQYSADNIWPAWEIFGGLYN